MTKSILKSDVAKAFKSIARYGIRDGLQDTIARWNQRNVPISRFLRDYEWLLNPDRPTRLTARASGPLRINWLIPNVGGVGSGGLYNIFRVIFHSEQWGHEHRVYMTDDTAGGEREATAAIRHNYFPIKAHIENLRDGVDDCDALVATSWKTAYAVRKLENTARKFYFVQDLENLFFPEGSFSEFVKETYRWGFYGITAGQWIASILEKDFGMQCSPFGFSYDRGTYSPIENLSTGQKKRVLFYARHTTERRGVELGILSLAIVAREMPEVEFVLVGLPHQPARLPFPAIIPGVLAPRDLAALYRSCTVSLVLSHTNLSLLPLEVMACGCPVVSNAGPNVEWLLSQQAAQLARPTPRDLAEAILALLKDKELHARKVAAGIALAASTDWIAEIKKIESAFYQGLNISRAGNPRV